jgi:hypothetical protein
MKRFVGSVGENLNTMNFYVDQISEAEPMMYLIQAIWQLLL